MLPIDAPYLTADLAHVWGFEDAAAGHDQRGSAYFEIMSPIWHAYNEGYAEGCAVLFLLTGSSRNAWTITEDTHL